MGRPEHLHETPVAIESFVERLHLGRRLSFWRRRQRLQVDRRRVACKFASVWSKFGSFTAPFVSTSKRITILVSGPSPGTDGAAPPMHVRFGAPA
jgi:hypothetical protein